VFVLGRRGLGQAGDEGGEGNNVQS
jgi:hypothetical protein